MASPDIYSRRKAAAIAALREWTGGATAQSSRLSAMLGLEAALCVVEASCRRECTSWLEIRGRASRAAGTLAGDAMRRMAERGREKAALLLTLRRNLRLGLRAMEQADREARDRERMGERAILDGPRLLAGAGYNVPGSAPRRMRMAAQSLPSSTGTVAAGGRRPQ